MPKRQNPFGDCSPLQLKSHIASKDVEKCSEAKMEDVFGKFVFIRSSFCIIAQCKRFGWTGSAIKCASPSF